MGFHPKQLIECKSSFSSLVWTIAVFFSTFFLSFSLLIVLLNHNNKQWKNSNKILDEIHIHKKKERERERYSFVIGYMQYTNPMAFFSCAWVCWVFLYARYCRKISLAFSHTFIHAFFFSSFWWGFCIDKRTAMCLFVCLFCAVCTIAFRHKWHISQHKWSVQKRNWEWE